MESAPPPTSTPTGAAEQVDVVAPTHGHFDHVGDDAADVVELAARGGTVVGSHETSIYLGEKGVEAVGMNKGGTFEAAGIRFTMVHADHTGGVTITTGRSSRQAATSAAGAGCIQFEDGTRLYHTGDTDLFGDMALVRDRWAPSIAVLPIGGHYTMGPADAARAVGPHRRQGGHPRALRHLPQRWPARPTSWPPRPAQVVALEPGETWEA